LYTLPFSVLFRHFSISPKLILQAVSSFRHALHLPLPPTISYLSFSFPFPFFSTSSSTSPSSPDLHRRLRCLHLTHHFHAMFRLPPLAFFLLQLPNFLRHPLPFRRFGFLPFLLLLCRNLPQQLCLNLCLLSQSLLRPFFLFLLPLSLLL